MSRLPKIISACTPCIYHPGALKHLSRVQMQACVDPQHDASAQAMREKSVEQLQVELAAAEHNVVRLRDELGIAEWRREFEETKT